LGREVPGVETSTCDGLCTPHNIDPALLGDNLEENEQRAPKIVEIVIRVRCNSWGKHVPIVAERGTIPFAETVREVRYPALVVIAYFHQAVEKVYSIYSKRDQ
jgi:hypothetical protein